MLEHWRAALQLYYRPVRALNALLDHGSGAAAILLALAVVVLFWTQGPAPPHAGRRMTPNASAQAAVDAEEEAPRPEPLERALGQAYRFVVPAGLAPFAMVLVVFIPTAIIVIAQWEALGSTGVILRRDYMPLVATVLTSWAAAYLPAAILRAVLMSSIPFAAFALPVAAHIYFLVLAAISVRVVMGASTGRAAAAVAAGWCASVLVLAGSGIWTPILYYLTSPWILYMLYRGTSFELGSLTSGLSGRQALKHSLEMAAINPRDADAQHQLGLLYLQRRNYTEAAARFRTAVAIDNSAAESYYELGRIMAIESRYDEALELLRRAAALDDKLSSSEVWREIGAVELRNGNAAAALTALQKYTDRREYDPAGLVYYGQALVQAKRAAEARPVFERAIEAVKTMPPHRRRQLRQWGREAENSLKSL